MIKLIEENKEQLNKICKLNSVAELYVFGSILSDGFNEDSDLDFAVTFINDLSPIAYGDAFLNLLDGLEELFNRKIDLVSYRVIKNPIFKEELDRTKKSIYAAA